MKEEKAQELLELVKNNYQDIAADFDATRKKEIWPEIRIFADKVKVGDSVLDLGCGNGRLLEALKGKEIEYIGVDNSFGLIKLAQANYPAERFVVGDALALDNIDSLAGRKYNFIFCLAVLQHIPSEELKVKALRLMADKLTDEGEIIISNWNLWEHKKYKGILIRRWFLGLFNHGGLAFNDLIFPWNDSRGEQKSRRYYHAFTVKELKRLALSAGLKISVLKKDKYNFWMVLKK